jgi:hypothetical protein
VDARGVLVERFVGRQDRGQFLVLDPDVVERIARDLLADGGDGGHLFAGEADRAFGQDAALLVMHAPHRARRVGPGQHRLDARQRQRRRGIDGDDARMRIGAAQHRCVQHARDLEVARVLGAPQHLGARIDLRHVLPQGRMVGSRRHGSCYSADTPRSRITLPITS